MINLVLCFDLNCYLQKMIFDVLYIILIKNVKNKIIYEMFFDRMLIIVFNNYVEDM